MGLTNTHSYAFTSPVTRTKLFPTGVQTAQGHKRVTSMQMYNYFILRITHCTYVSHDDRSKMPPLVIFF